MKKQGKLQRKPQRGDLGPRGGVTLQPSSVSKKHKSTITVTSSVAASVAHVGTKSSEVIDTNQCCVCYRTFADDEREETGLEWVECVCTRWLHEQCIDYDIEVDADGRELICHYCAL